MLSVFGKKCQEQAFMPGGHGPETLGHCALSWWPVGAHYERRGVLYSLIFIQSTVGPDWISSQGNSMPVMKVPWRPGVRWGSLPQGEWKMSTHNLWHLNAPFPVGSPTWAGLLLGLSWEGNDLYHFVFFLCFLLAVWGRSPQLSTSRSSHQACCLLSLSLWTLTLWNCKHQRNFFF